MVGELRIRLTSELKRLVRALSEKELLVLHQDFCK
jgi:hypothetical protein